MRLQVEIELRGMGNIGINNSPRWTIARPVALSLVDREHAQVMTLGCDHDE